MGGRSGSSKMRSSAALSAGVLGTAKLSNGNYKVTTNRGSYEFKTKKEANTFVQNRIKRNKKWLTHS